ncbi:short-chain dehydrogenase [Apiospora saccharicola]|uniref:Short-chain dehydrogenase n=1 Tax=Apiospora saccharicola TaxID=335842 RepID=A0ABR1VB85_9PEZI
MSGPSWMEQLSQLFPPKPQFTEKNLPDLHGKASPRAFRVYFITGANTGVGKELARMLYAKNATVYLAARSEEKARRAIEEIRQNAPLSSTGKLVFVQLDLADLTTIKGTVKTFLDQESQLHVLFNNAGVMKPAPGTTTVQGYEPQLGVNNVGTFLLTKLLTPTLAATARREAATTNPGQVRVVWVSSSAAEAPPSPTGGVPLDNLDYHKPMGWFPQYCISKAGNYLHASEYARRHGPNSNSNSSPGSGDGILSVSLNPGNLDSELWRNQTFLVRKFLQLVLLHPPVMGAYTELYAGLSPELNLEEHSGGWVVPWGRPMRIRSDLQEATRTKAEGGSGIGKGFWEWSERQVERYL